MTHKSKKIVFLCIGWLFTALGFIGAFLPLLPTTPFLLVAVWAFSKSSEKLRHWLMTHPKFGPHLQNWYEEGAIDPKAKALAIFLMAISFGFSVYFSTSMYVPVMLLIILVASATFILTRPSPSSVAIKSQSS